MRCEGPCSIGALAVSAELQAKIAGLCENLRRIQRVVVAFSGGVDSAFLAYAAVQALGTDSLAVTGVSPSLARGERAGAEALAAWLGIAHRLLPVNELSDPAYAANGPDRCYHCKRHLFAALDDIACREGYNAVLDGSNADDLADDRPGRRAAVEWGVRSPLVDHGFSKADIRNASRAARLPTADKPASPCLASRFPTGVRVTEPALAMVERAEAVLRELGIPEGRVRYHGDLARLEIPTEVWRRVTEEPVRRVLLDRLRGCGFRHVTFDLRLFREPLAAVVGGDGRIPQGGESVK